MKKLMIIALFILTAPSYTIVAQSKQKHKPVTERQQIIAIEYRWVKSYITGDTSFLKSLFSEEAKFISTKGEVTSTQSEIAELKQGAVRYNTFDTSDIDPVFYGNTAVVTNKSHINATVISSGKTVDLQVRALDIFVKKHGQWKLVASQITKINL